MSNGNILTLLVLAVAACTQTTERYFFFTGLARSALHRPTMTRGLKHRYCKASSSIYNNVYCEQYKVLRTNSIDLFRNPQQVSHSRALLRNN